MLLLFFVALQGVALFHSPLILAQVQSLPATTSSSSPSPRPKYGPQATRLYSSHDFIRQSAAPDFWALMPYYVHQQDDRSCSVATLTMIVNAARASQTLTASDELVTQSELLKKVNSTLWKKGVGKGGQGVTLDQLGQLAESALKVYGFSKVKVQTIHADPSKNFKDEMRKILINNEKSAQSFLVVNFLQSEYTGDPDGAFGHISPVAAYDEKNQRVLVLDTDRKWYEPYWISEETLFKGMMTVDGTHSKTRGLVYIQLEHSNE